MQFFILILFFCFFIFLFTVYVLSHDDFLFLRKDVKMEDLFNLAFIIGILALFFSRFFHVILFPQPVFFNILGFLAIPYYPGLSLVGGIAGGSLAFYFLTKARKIPTGRTYDFFMIGTVVALIPGFLLSLLIQGLNLFLALQSLIYLVLLIIIFRFIFPLLTRGRIREGAIGLFSLFSIAIISLFFSSLQTSFNFMFPKNIALSIVVLFSFFALLFSIRRVKKRELK